MSVTVPAFQLPTSAAVDPPNAACCPDSPRSVASDDDDHHQHAATGRAVVTLTSFADHTSGAGPQQRFDEVPASTTVSYRPCDDYSQSVHHITNNMSMTRDHLATSTGRNHQAAAAAPPPPPLASSLGGLPKPTEDFAGLDLPPVSLAGATLLPPAVQRRRTGDEDPASPDEYRPFDVPSQRSGANSTIANSSPHPRSIAVRSDAASDAPLADDREAHLTHACRRELPPPPPKGSTLGGLPLGNGSVLPVSLPPSVLSQLGTALPSSLLPPPRHFSMTSHADFSDSDSDA